MLHQMFRQTLFFYSVHPVGASFFSIIETKNPWVSQEVAEGANDINIVISFDLQNNSGKNS